MACKDISDKQVCAAHAEYQANFKEWPYEILERQTGQPFKVCWRAMERAFARGLTDYGVSLRTAWLTEQGKALMEVNNLTYQELRQRTGDPESLWMTLKVMLVHGEVEKTPLHPHTTIHYQLA